MSAVADVVRRCLGESGSDAAERGADTSFEALITAVREALYRDYSLWDAEFDCVERVITRTLATAQTTTDKE